VPIPNAYEWFQGKPKEMLAVMQHNYEFFSEYIWGEKPA